MSCWSNDVSDIATAAWLSVVVAAVAVGAHCSHHAGHQGYHIPYLHTGCLLCLFHPPLACYWEEVFDKWHHSKLQLFRKDAIWYPMSETGRGITVIFKLELWSKRRVQISPFFIPLSGSQMLIFRLSNHNHYTSFDIRDSELEECLTSVGRSAESECMNSHTPSCSELFTRRFLLPLLGRTLRWIFTHWHLEEGD